MLDHLHKELTCAAALFFCQKETQGIGYIFLTFAALVEKRGIFLYRRVSDCSVCRARSARFCSSGSPIEFLSRRRGPFFIHLSCFASQGHDNPNLKSNSNSLECCFTSSLEHPLNLYTTMNRTATICHVKRKEMGIDRCSSR